MLTSKIILTQSSNMRKTAFYFLFLSLFLVPFATLAEETEKDLEHRAVITDIGLTTSTKHLLLFARIENGISEDLIKGLHSGIPIQFSFFLELKKIKSKQLEKEKSQYTFNHTLKYNTLKENYQVKLQEESRPKHSFTKLEDGLTALTEINGFKLLDKSQMIHGTSYRLRIKAELKKKTLPMNLHYIIPFFSGKTKETEWHSVTFSY